MSGRKLVPVAVMVGCLAGLYLLAPSQERFEEQAQVNQALAAAEVPPTLALSTIALGPLRGLIGNVLWWRSVRLQDEGNYFEAIQLADWITALQPKLEMVWRYQGWNMAYNISAGAKTREERWEWILAGMKLLRDRGLAYNPHSGPIKQELAALFYTKLCKTTDEDHLYFKERWARHMSDCFRRGDREEIEQILQAPAGPEEIGEDPVLAEFVRGGQALGLDFSVPDQTPPFSQWTPAQQEYVRSVPEKTEAYRRYRARWLLERRERLDLEYMLFIDEEYGPFDWRLGHGYAVYFGAPESYDEYIRGMDVDYPVVRGAMMESFEAGRIAFIDPERFVLANNLAIAGKVHDYMEALLERARGTEPERSIKASFRNFHEFMAIVLYNYGYDEESREFYRALVDEGLWDEEQARRWTYERFIRERGPEMLNVGGNVSDAQSAVTSTLYQAYYNLALGEDHRARGFARMAQRIWEHNQRRYREVPGRLLPPYADLQEAALNMAIINVPPRFRPLLEGIRDHEGAANYEIQPSGAPPEIFLGEHHEGEDRYGAADEDGDEHGH